MSDIYYIAWQGKYSGADYRLEVMPSGATQITTPNYIKLPISALEINELEWNFKELPFGISSDCKCKITWNLDEIGDNTLIAKLFSPTTQFELPTDVDPVPFNAGNLYTLYYNNNVVYRGVQVADEAMSFDGSTKYEVDLVGLGKYLLSCFDLKQFVFNESHMYRLSSKYSPAIFEYYDKYNHNSVRAIINTQSKISSEISKDRFYFWSVQNFEIWLKNALKFCAAKILRKNINDVNFEFELPFATYYKQDYAGNQNIGAKLNKNELMLLTYIYNDRKKMAVGGLFSNAEDALPSRYSTWYDFLSDLAESEGQKLFVHPNGLIIKPLPLFNANPSVLDLNNKIEGFKELRKFNVKQITVSLEEFGENDVDNYRYQNGVLRNDDELQIALIFNNTPPANTYQKLKSNAAEILTLGGDDTIIVQFDYYLSKGPCRVWNLYYFDTPVGLTAERAFRVHDFCRVSTRIRNDVDTEALGTTPSVASVPYTTINDAQRYCLAVQREHAKASMFKGFSRYFGLDGTSKLKVELPITDFNVFFGANTLFKFNATNYNNYAINYPEDYYLTKISCNLETEIFEIELVGVKV